MDIAVSIESVQFVINVANEVFDADWSSFADVYVRFDELLLFQPGLRIAMLDIVDPVLLWCFEGLD